MPPAKKRAPSAALTIPKPTELENTLRPVKSLRTALGSTAATKRTLADAGVSGVCKEVRTLEPTSVRDEIENICVRAVLSVLKGEGFSYAMPSRAASNVMYVPDLDRVVLRDKVLERVFANASSARKTAVTTRVMQLVVELCTKGIHVTKRDLFYTDVKLFKQQTESDDVIDDVACMVGCTRSSLNVVAAEKGVVVGRVIFDDDGDTIDCTKMGVGGKAIPPSIDRVTNVRGDAQFVLLIEKDAAFMRLAEDRFYNAYPCVIISGKGQPDVATRLFLNKVRTELNIPVLGLFDADPYGLKILSVYMKGSKNMSYDSLNLTTPDIKWLGVRPSDLDKYRIPLQCRLEMTEHDIRTGKELLNEDFVKANPEWHAELQIMVSTKVKAEIQALSSFGFQYLSQEFLPRKLREGDWI
uniref:DNA topoisomerase (ATP-hydrolyzing) n=1 Tax=Chrysotila carterae TaxID=13221 RepID=A0A7S4B373_CHRCT